MNKFKSVISVLLCVISVISLVGCKGSLPKARGVETPDTNVLKDYEEVVEFNAYSVVPELLGTPRSLIENNFTLMSGVENYFETYLSTSNTDITCYVGSRTMRYSPSATDELYINGIRVRTQDKKIETANGKRKVTYVTDKYVMGMQVGIESEEACKTLEAFGYTKLYEQPVITSGVASSREISYQKGIIIISMAVETSGEVSSFYAWIPYDTSEIEQTFDNSHVPAKLGLIYNCYGSPVTEFSFLQKTESNSARVYTAEDGSVAVMHGYPDASDMMMCAQVTFSSKDYNVDGASVGMTFRECIDKLTAAGWTLLKDSSTLTKGEITLKLFDVDSLEFSDNPTVIGEDKKVVTYIRYYLPSPSSFDRISKDS